MNKLTLMVGLPASGKSTYAKEMADDNTVVLSSDALRKELLGDERCQDDNDIVFKTLYRRAKECLLEGKDVVIDATNINMKARRRALANFANMDIRREAVVMATPYEVCLKRDKLRERTVGEEVIKKFLYRFEVPMAYEGFSCVAIVKAALQHPLRTIWSKSIAFDQKNAHHKYTLDEHMDRCAFEVEQRSRCASLIEAAKSHDIGKPYTQTFGEDGQAHYYSHHNVSAYYYMCCQGVGDVNEIFYINFHMLPFFWKDDRTREKYRRLFGDFRYANLMLLHECDKIASGTREE